MMPSTQSGAWLLSAVRMYSGANRNIQGGSASETATRAMVVQRTAAAIEHLALERGPTPVARKAVLGADEFARSFALESQPIVLSGFVSDPDREPWQPDALRRSHGSMEVEVRVGDYVAQAFGGARQTIRSTLAGYLDTLAELHTVQSALPPYVAHQPIPADLAAAWQRPPYYPEWSFATPAFWLGPGGSATPLHQDMVDNFVMQVVGAKRFALVSPCFTADLYVESRSPFLRCSPVDLHNIDLDRFPKAAGLRVEYLSLCPGDLLFLPAGWFHQVDSQTLSLSINAFVSYLPPASVAGMFISTLDTLRAPQR